MVQGINTTNTPQKKNNADSPKRQAQVSVPKQNLTTGQDRVVIKKKRPAQPKQKGNALQTTVLVLGGLASLTLTLALAIPTIIALTRKKSLNLKNLVSNPDLPPAAKAKIDEVMKSPLDDIKINYINQINRVPWKRVEPKNIDTKKAQEVLDSEHLGMAKVKDEIMSFIKMQNYNIRKGVKNNGPLILCLDGPPGVGKTSIAESVAKAMDRKFERISLAGVSYQTFITGTQQVFKGAEPGQIIKALQNAQVSNPVILIDEIDKMGSSTEHGSPAHALLDILEPKQCKQFKDAYLELPYDLSDVTFIITSNDIGNIPPMLKDRLTIINVPPYQKQEKLNIADKYVKKSMDELKMDPAKVQFNNEALNEIVDRTTDKGARRTIDNVKSVFNNIIKTIETIGENNPILVNRQFVAEALKNRQEPTTAANTVNGFSINDLLKLWEKTYGQQA